MSDRKKTNKQTHTQTLLNSRITILKYLFSIILMILGRRSAGSNKMLFCGLLELLVIWMLTEVIRSFRVRAVVNGILMLLLNAQMLILWFGGDYISLVMLTNLDNVRDLSGKIVIYILGIVITLVFSFYPPARLLDSRKGKDGDDRICRSSASLLLSAVLCAELLFTFSIFP